MEKQKARLCRGAQPGKMRLLGFSIGEKGTKDKEKPPILAK